MHVQRSRGGAGLADGGGDGKAEGGGDGEAEGGGGGDGDGGGGDGQCAALFRHAASIARQATLDLHLTQLDKSFVKQYCGFAAL